MLDLPALVLACAPAIAPDTMLAVIGVESSGNPYAIGVVDGRLERQPETLAEAVSTMRALEAAGWNYSVGLAQVNRQHFERFGFDDAGAFDACANVAAGAEILAECYGRARAGRDEQPALRAALSCYYSGTFTVGQRPEADGTSYVDRIMNRVTPD